MDRREVLKYSGVLFASMMFSQLTSKTTGLINKLEPVKKDENVILLNFNENSLGLFPSAKSAIEKQLTNAFRYPDALIEDLCNQLTKKFNFKREEIVLAPGSSDVLRAATQAWINKALAQKIPVQLLLPSPTFSLIAEYTQRMNLGISIVTIPLTDKYEMDIEKMKSAAESFAGISIIYLCNPNNPTATLTPSNLMSEWIRSSKTDRHYFIMDEAYAEYVTDPDFVSGMELVHKGQPNIIVTRTFSKIYAMAGLRVGYGFAVPELANQIRAYSDYDGLNFSGVVAASASLQDQEYLHKSLAMTNETRSRVEDLLKELDIKYLPSQANFIFYEIKGDLDTYIERMKSYHIMVGRKFPPLTQWNRVSLGTPQEMEIFMEALKDFRRKNWV